MSKLDTWCESLKRLVQADGSRAATIVLEGPDGTQWGSWSADLQDLAETVRQAMHMTGEELPSGSYNCKVIALDGNREQLSALTQTVRGRNSAAMLAANEHRSMQQAVALAQANMEAQTVGLRSENERLRKLLDEATDNQSLLLERFLKVQSTNLEVELRMREHQERKEAFAGLIKELTPLVQVGSALLAEYIDERIKEKKAEKEAAKLLRSRPSDTPQATPSSPSDKSSDTTPTHGSPEAQGAKREGSVSDPGGPSLGVASGPGPGEASSSGPSQASPIQDRLGNLGPGCVGVFRETPVDLAPPTRKDPPRPRRTNHAAKKPVRATPRG